MGQVTPTAYISECRSASRVSSDNACLILAVSEPVRWCCSTAFLVARGGAGDRAYVAIDRKLAANGYGERTCGGWSYQRDGAVSRSSGLCRQPTSSEPLNISNVWLPARARNTTAPFNESTTDLAEGLVYCGLCRTDRINFERIDTS
jgi:hypothetical protein